MSMIEHAEAELRAAGMDKPVSDYNGMVYEAVMELVRTLASQGHSGGSASIALSLFDRLARREVLTPLQGTDDEWIDQSDVSGCPMWQSKRCGRVFKGADGQAYELVGNDRRLDVRFPHMPVWKP